MEVSEHLTKLMDGKGQVRGPDTQRILDDAERQEAKLAFLASKAGHAFTAKGAQHFKKFNDKVDQTVVRHLEKGDYACSDQVQTFLRRYRSHRSLIKHLPEVMKQFASKPMTAPRKAIYAKLVAIQRCNQGLPQLPKLRTTMRK